MRAVAVVMVRQSSHGADATASGVEQQRVAIGAPAGQPCIRGCTGVLEPASQPRNAWMACNAMLESGATSLKGLAGLGAVCHDLRLA